MRNVWSLKRELDALKLYAISLTERVDQLDRRDEPIPVPDHDEPVGPVPRAFIVNLGRSDPAAYVNGSIIQPRNYLVYYLEDIHDPFTQTYGYMGTEYNYFSTYGHVAYNGYLIGPADSSRQFFYFTCLPSQPNHNTVGMYDVGAPQSEVESAWLSNNQLYLVAGTQYAIVDDFPNTPWSKIQKHSFPDNLTSPIVINDYIYGIDSEDPSNILQYNMATEQLTEFVLPESVTIRIYVTNREWIIYSNKQYVIRYTDDSSNIYVSTNGTEFVTLDLSDLAANAQVASIVSVPQGFMICVEVGLEESLYFANELLDVSTYQPITSLPSQISYKNMKVIRQASPNITMVMIDTYLFMFTDDPKMNTQYPPQPIDESIPESLYSVFSFGIACSGTGSGLTWDGDEKIEYLEVSPYYDDIETIDFVAESTDLGDTFTVNSLSRRGQSYDSPEEAGMEFKSLRRRDNYNFNNVAWKVNNRNNQYAMTRPVVQATTAYITVLVKVGPIPGVDE